jgi:hypothetical protein
MNLRRLVLTLGVTLSLLSPTLGHAAQPVTGALAFTGSAHLGTFPCAGCTDGTFSGTLTGSIAGVSGGIPWSVVNFVAPFSATFDYNDSCTQVGLANGGGTIDTVLGNTIGTYGPVLGVLQFPESVVELKIPFTFAWNRVGLTAVLTPITFSEIDLRVVEPGPVETWKTVATNLSAVAVAGFVPTTVPSCPTGASPLSADVAGALVVTPSAP